MNKNVIIIGASGHGKVIADIVCNSNDNIVGFLDDAYNTETDFYGSKILGTTELINSYKDNCCFIIAIGSNSIRKAIAEKFNCQWYTAIHPSAQVSKSAMVGEGTAIMANAVVNPDAKIGAHTIINTGAIVEHDCVIGNYTHISPRATVCGVTTVGNSCWLGAGSTVKNVLTICDNTIVGLGSAVIKSITAPGTYVGVPAKKIGE